LVPFIAILSVNRIATTGLVAGFVVFLSSVNYMNIPLENAPIIWMAIF